MTDLNKEALDVLGQRLRVGYQDRDRFDAADTIAALRVELAEVEAVPVSADVAALIARMGDLTAHDYSLPDDIETALRSLDRERSALAQHYEGAVAQAGRYLDRAEQAESAIAAMTQRAEAAERDARRYRWWRENYGVENDGPDSFKLYTLVGTRSVASSDDFDAAIDAAIADRTDANTTGAG